MQELSKILETSLGGYSLSRILSAVLTLLVCLIVSRLLLSWPNGCWTAAKS